MPRPGKEIRDRQGPLAQEILKRQIFDWREQANVGLEQPAAREAILKLARAIVAAAERVRAAAPPAAPTPAAAQDVATLEARYASASRAANIEQESGRPALEQRTILWVDDLPDNNAWERRALEGYGMQFVLARSTEQAEDLLRLRSFDAVISDLGRPRDRRAGFTLLRRTRVQHPHAPYFIYCGSRDPELVREAQAQGAQGLTNDPAELISMVLAALR